MSYEFDGVTVGEVRKLEADYEPAGYILVNDIRNGLNIPERALRLWTSGLLNRRGKPAFKGAEEAIREACEGLWVVYKYLKTNTPEDEHMVTEERTCYMPMSVFLERTKIS